jgi:murein DD-endopeptidase MepM/ murein hydrolase activator NlpD
MRRGRRTGAPTFHAGLDFHAPRGTLVWATKAGTVAVVPRTDRRRGPFDGYGNAVVVQHDGENYQGYPTLWTFYAHLDEVFVPEGSFVDAGTPIGRVGNTTNGKFPGMGPHLHLELRHARSDGSSPFPGPYRRLNLDPEPWMARHGLTFGRRGVFIFDERVAGCFEEPERLAYGSTWGEPL